MVYLDNAATTKMSPAALAAQTRLSQEIFANPSSLHAAGFAAEREVEAARAAIAAALNVKNEEIYFGAGGTFCNNTAIFGAARANGRTKKRVVISNIEHACVRESAMQLASEGFEVIAVPPTVQDFAAAIDGNTVLVSCMLVNNETGLILPVEQIACVAHDAGALMHVDAVQAFGKMPVDVGALGADLLTISAHKIHGPKGSGALYIKKGVRVRPIVFGGGQEKSMISGTLNSPAIAAFGAAVREMSAQLCERRVHFAALETHFLKQAADRKYLQLNRDNRPHAPHIINVSFMGYLGENVLHFLETKEIYVSVGSACSDHAHHGSILAAMGKDRKTVDGALRISFGCETTKAEIDAFFAAADEAEKTLIKKYRG